MSLHSLGYPGTHGEDQAEFELKDPAAFVFLMLGLKAGPPRPVLPTGVFVCLIVVFGFVVVEVVVVCLFVFSFFNHLSLVKYLNILQCLNTHIRDSNIPTCNLHGSLCKYREGGSFCPLPAHHGLTTQSTPSLGLEPGGGGGGGVAVYRCIVKLS